LVPEVLFNSWLEHTQKPKGQMLGGICYLLDLKGWQGWGWARFHTVSFGMVCCYSVVVLDPGT
jgi:hypothetical protein